MPVRAPDEVNQAFQAVGITCPLPEQSTVTEAARFEKGLAVQQEIFGTDAINAMRANAPAELKRIQDCLSAYRVSPNTKRLSVSWLMSQPFSPEVILTLIDGPCFSGLVSSVQFCGLLSSGINPDKIC